jgi:hypothetical protein
VKVAKGHIRWFLKVVGHKAITLPPFGVYALQECLEDVRLQKHEAKHWQQYLSMGLVKFYAVYLWLSLRHGYWDNPMEVEAREAEHD